MTDPHQDAERRGIPEGTPRGPQAFSSEDLQQLKLEVDRLYPEVPWGTVDLEQHAPSILKRALNDAPQRVCARVLAYYGFERARSMILPQLNYLTNPAYRAYREVLDLPDRDPEVTKFQSIWMP